MDSRRRRRGTGSLYVRIDSAGRESWYGHWRSNGRQVKRKIGPKRSGEGGPGLTRLQAEEKLATLMGLLSSKPAPKGTLSAGYSLIRRAVAEVARVEANLKGGGAFAQGELRKELEEARVALNRAEDAVARALRLTFAGY